jgi:hypothetical protein
LNCGFPQATIMAVPLLQRQRIQHSRPKEKVPCLYAYY